MEVASTSGVSTSTQVPDPKFIQYLFNPARIADCYLLVGNPSISPPEKIGVVHEMLSAHSEVLRSDLQSLNIKEKTPITIPDIMPRTFKILLRYVYGYDTTATLTFDDADNLLYVAEKYIMTELKDKVATRLIGLLNADNVCSLLNNPVCFQALALNAQINEILEMETKKVFQSPHFLELTDDAFVKILEKETLNIREIDIWHKAIEWAKHKAKLEDGKTLREQLVRPLKYIRMCTLTSEEFCREVIPTEVLSDHEIVEVCRSFGQKKKEPKLKQICNEVKMRNVSLRRRVQEVEHDQNPTTSLKRKRNRILQDHLYLRGDYVDSQRCSFIIETKDETIELESFEIRCDERYKEDDEEYNFWVCVENMEDPTNSISANFPPLALNSLLLNITISCLLYDFTLSPHSRYKVFVSCNMLLPARTSLVSTNEHYTVHPYSEEKGEFCIFVREIRYRLS